MNQTGTIRLEFKALEELVFYREYNYATPQAIMDEFRWISFLDGFKTPNEELFDRIDCFWQYDRQPSVKQWTLLVD